jgi:hypothetical protein
MPGYWMNNYMTHPRRNVLKEVGELTSVVTYPPCCFLCGAKDGDRHWSMCPTAPAGTLSDDDPDRDDGPNEWE